MESESEGIESRLEGTEETSQDEAEASEVVEYLNRGETLNYLSRDERPASKEATNRKPNAKKEETHSLVEKIRYGAGEYGIGATEYLGSVIAERPIYATTGEDKYENTNKGAAAIIYNQETGEFYFELKPHSYPIKEARGKLALVGGHVEHGESSLEALMREIGEEVVEPKAQKILKDKLTQLGTYYHTIVEFVDGVRIETDVYLINVDSDKDWTTVKNSALTEGLKQVLKYDEINFSGFAFKHEGPLIKLINKEYNDSHLTQGIHYALPIGSIINNHSQFANQAFPSMPYENNTSLKLAA